MPVTIETLGQEKYRRGKAFTFLHSELALAAGSSADFVVCVGDRPVALSQVNLTSNGEVMSWIAFVGTQITEGTGNELSEIPRNSNVDSESGLVINLDPTITNSGQPFFANPIDLVAQVGAGNRAYLDANLISELFSFQPGACYLIRVTNTDSSSVKYEITFDIFTE